MAVGRPPLSFMLRKPPRQDFQTDGNQVIIEVRGTQGFSTAQPSPSCPPHFPLPLLPHVLVTSSGHPRVEAHQGTLQGRDQEWILLVSPFPTRGN